MFKHRTESIMIQLRQLYVSYQELSRNIYIKHRHANTPLTGFFYKSPIFINQEHSKKAQPLQDKLNELLTTIEKNKIKLPKDLQELLQADHLEINVQEKDITTIIRVPNLHNLGSFTDLNIKTSSHSR
ncbi:MAG: hypothetical protein A3F12_05620 [Gammaproteobacteria bacterium RIFCSPHIGHO2_12_FULL_38_14]|nr:MAG: hypothetical protein A3F12_05620 [Gammaproteobacteria bacterium RIFCSPHIGHO2_12_FULL_38_14]